MPKPQPSRVNAEVAERVCERFDPTRRGAHLYQDYLAAMREEPGCPMICGWLDFAHWLLERESRQAEDARGDRQ